MKVELIDHSCKAQETIAQSSGVCYGNDSKDPTRIKRLKQHKHLATFRFAHAVFKISDISIACRDQIVRSKHLDFLVQSFRYTTPKKAVYTPQVIQDRAWSKAQQRLLENAYSMYEVMVDDGVPKEDARMVLPVGMLHSMYVAGNFQAWNDFLKLRVSKHAQTEIRMVAIYIWSTLAINFPLVFADMEFESKKLSEWEVTL